MTLQYSTDSHALKCQLVRPSDLDSLSQSSALKKMGFFAKPKDTVILASGDDLLLFVGLEEKSSDRFLTAGAVALKAARKARHSFLHFSTFNDATEARDCALGAALASYTYRDTKSPNPEEQDFNLEGIYTDSHEQSFQEGLAIGLSMNLSRRLGDLPGNIATPTYLADTAQQLAQTWGFEVKIIEEAEAESLGMGSFCSVARGSDQPGKVIILRQRSGSDEPPVLLVGKGLTFDSGGISIKPSAAMEEMKYDMCGGAAVLGTFDLIGRLGIKKDVVGIIPATENMPNGNANKPGDIVKAYNGTTIEIINTDAEGRLILCDAIAYGAKTYQPSCIADIATLTGACVVALGSHAIGVISNDDELASTVTNAAQKYQERLWQLPAFDEYDEQLRSDYADIQNVGGKEAGTITAGLFLRRFVPKGTPWVHLDIAGTGWDGKKEYFHKKGATGSGVRAFYGLITNK
ncbi:leucyl aminopeptidase [Desulfurispira natronophila]|uniref:Probable cytosol aminopeptidase n=1 Tax=Desulfurispira natronophila TaxID=682562 RepID=A0A7W8DFU6_9BACT|nr:leucyl aminopeptidase [Desulfurispira natronophila]MBB5020806.1 leucyl aminopeptidase [Desulfurispira natronophila]